MNKQEVMDLLATEGITLADVIDAVIGQNGIIGVGLISLGDQVRSYIVHNGAGANPENRKFLPIRPSK